MKVLVTGASGFIGSNLCQKLIKTGDSVVGLSRNPTAAKSRVSELSNVFAWNLMEGPPPPEAFSGVDAVIHLAGESVAGRWTKAKKKRIQDSRSVGTANLVRAMADLEEKPAVFISSSAIGFYGDRGDEELDEDQHPGNDFLASICRDWEEQAERAESAGIRTVWLRTGIVIGKGGGALAAMLLPAKLGLGGPLGSGKQWWSWIHMDDLTSIFLHLLKNDIRGAVNGTAPSPVRQADFAKSLGKIVKRPAFMPAPAFAIRLMLGEFATELLTSKRVLPTRALETGYQFKYPNIDGAIRAALESGVGRNDV